MTRPLIMGRTYNGTYDPWVHLGQLMGRRQIRLLWHDDGPMGEIDFENKTISLRRDQTPREARSTLAHELAHFTRGLVDVGHRPSEEVLVCFTAAARLVPAHIIKELPDLVSKHGREAARDYLDLDDDTLSWALQISELARQQDWDYMSGTTQAARA